MNDTDGNFRERRGCGRQKKNRMLKAASRAGKDLVILE